MGVQEIPVEELAEVEVEAPEVSGADVPQAQPEPQPKKRGRPRKDAAPPKAVSEAHAKQSFAPPKAPKAAPTAPRSDLRSRAAGTAAPKAPRAAPKAPIAPPEPFEALSNMSSVQLLSELVAVVGRQRQTERERKQQMYNSFVF